MSECPDDLLFLCDVVLFRFFFLNEAYRGKNYIGSGMVYSLVTHTAADG